MFHSPISRSLSGDGEHALISVASRPAAAWWISSNELTGWARVVERCLHSNDAIFNFRVTVLPCRMSTSTAADGGW